MYLTNTELCAEYIRTEHRYYETTDLAEVERLWGQLQRLQDQISERTETSVFLAHGLIAEDSAE